MTIDPPGPRRLNKEQGSCIHCLHPLGYHHLEGESCSCKDCTCPGYEANSRPERLQNPSSGRDLVNILVESPLADVEFDRLTVKSSVRDIEP